MYKMPLVKGKPRARNKDGTWRKKRSDTGKKRGETMSNQDPISEINNIAFAAKNQIIYWKRNKLAITTDRISSIQTAIEGIINICDNQSKEDDVKEQETR